MTGVIDTLLAASPSRKSITMCVDGALQAEWDRTRQELEDAGRSDAESGSLALPAVTEVVNRLDALRERVIASGVTFLFERWDWTERIKVQAEHPPRDDVIADRIRGFNTETFYREQIRRSCVSVTGVDGDEVTDIPDQVWASLLGTPATDDTPAVAGSLNMRQVDRLIGAANQVNDGETAVPPSARSLLVSQDSGASLAQPSPGTSPRNGSAAGNRRGSRKSSTTKKATTSKARSSGS